MILREFAVDRNKGIKKISAQGEVILEHIMKCCIYGNSTNNLNHWVNDEISQYFYVISALDIKCGKNNKLKPNMYKKIVFTDSCETPEDMKFNLLDFKLRVNHNHKYPDFDVTSELVLKTYNIFRDISDVVCNKFAEPSKYSAKYFSNIVWSILEKYN